MIFVFVKPDRGEGEVEGFGGTRKIEGPLRRQGGKVKAYAALTAKETKITRI